MGQANSQVINNKHEICKAESGSSLRLKQTDNVGLAGYSAGTRLFKECMDLEKKSCDCRHVPSMGSQVN